MNEYIREARQMRMMRAREYGKVRDADIFRGQRGEIVCENERVEAKSC